MITLLLSTIGFLYYQRSKTHIERMELIRQGRFELKNYTRQASGYYLQLKPEEE